MALALIVVALALNLKGAGAVGKNATWTIGLGWGLRRPECPRAVAGGGGGLGGRGGEARARRGEMGGSLAVGLAAVIWNFCGWDNVSTTRARSASPAGTTPARS